MRDSPWFHQKRSESAPPVDRVKDAPSITPKEQEDMTARISRPTESALYRQSLFWKLDGFMDKGFHSWSKMDLFSDCKRCMWKGDGAIKGSCKIRPLNKSLPPLVSFRKGVQSCQGQRSDRSGRGDLQSRDTSRSSQEAGMDTSRLSMSVNGHCPVRGLSRDGLHLRRENSFGGSRGAPSFGLSRPHWHGHKSGVGAANLAVPRIAARPVAAQGQRV